MLVPLTVILHGAALGQLPCPLQRYKPHIALFLGGQGTELHRIHRLAHIPDVYKRQLKEKGYNPISQLVGYILSEDPTYITTHNNARSLIRRIDRDELLQVLLKSYLGE